jgi:mannose-6-phosphate isomerase-like protein (cupin superfamily)
MSDVTVASFEEMEPIYDGLARRARATLGVTAFGMQVLNLPPQWDGYPDHHHDATMDDANQEEVYIPIAGSAMLVAGEERFELRPGMMARVGPEQRRRILPGPEGVRFIALGGVPGTFKPSSWTELGGPLPVGS